MADQQLTDQLIQLLETSLSFGTLDEDKQALLKERLLQLSDDDMKKVIEAFRKEQRDQYESMKSLLNKIEMASSNLKKMFLQDKEKSVRKDEEKETDNLLKQIHNES